MPIMVLLSAFCGSLLPLPGPFKGHLQSVLVLLNTLKNASTNMILNTTQQEINR